MFGEILVDKIRINFPVYILIQKKLTLTHFNGG